MASRKKLLMKCILAACLTGMCIPFDSIEIFIMTVKNPAGMTDSQYFWLNSIIYAGIYGRYFISVLAALPYADCFCREYEQGLWRYLVARTGNLRYVIMNFVHAFLYGAGTLCGGGFLFLLCTRGICILFDESRYAEVAFLPFSELLLDHPQLYFLVMLYLLFLAGGLWSCAGYCFSVYAPVRHLVYLFPFVISFVLTRVSVMLQIPNRWRIDFMLCGRSGPENPFVYLALVSGIVFFMVCLFAYLFYRKLKWRMENE